MGQTRGRGLFVLTAGSRAWRFKTTQPRFELVGRELAKLELLSEFALSNTAMCGTIPTELGSLTQLQTLACPATRRFRARYRPSWAASHSCRR